MNDTRINKLQTLFIIIIIAIVLPALPLLGHSQASFDNHLTFIRNVEGQESLTLFDFSGSAPMFSTHSNYVLGRRSNKVWQVILRLGDKSSQAIP